MDRRYLGIGDLPSNGNVQYSFDEVCVRPLEVGDLTPLYTAISQTSIRNLVRVLTHCVSVDMHQLTDGDLFYALAWVRLYSYPKSSVTVTWKCNEPVILNRLKKIQLDPRLKKFSEQQLKDKGLHVGCCETKNTIPLSNVSIKQIRLPENAGLPEHLDYPRVATLIEYDEMYADDPSMNEVARLARWMKRGDTLAEKINFLQRLIRREGLDVLCKLKAIEANYFHGVKDVYVLDCHRCDTKTRVENIPNILKFFNTTSEESVLNMQFNLANAIHLQTGEDLPAKKLLYWHSCYEKDLIEKEEKRRLKEASRKQGRR